MRYDKTEMGRPVSDTSAGAGQAIFSTHRRRVLIIEAGLAHFKRRRRKKFVAGSAIQAYRGHCTALPNARAAGLCRGFPITPATWFPDKATVLPGARTA